MDEVVEVAGPDLAVLVGDIVSAYVSHNNLPASELPALLIGVHAALAGLGAPVVSAEPEVEKPTPAQIRKSITPDGIVSFIDGKSYKTLKRHLGAHGLDPSSYRMRYDLPIDYPMVAPSYAAMRAELARTIGLGQRRQTWPVRAPAPVVEAAPAAKRGRKRKAEPAEA